LSTPNCFRLLHRVHGVGAGVEEPEHLRARVLGCQQIRREVGRRPERVHVGLLHLAALVFDGGGEIGEHLLSERVVATTAYHVFPFGCDAMFEPVEWASA